MAIPTIRLRAHNFIERTGQRVGRLTVLSRADNIGTDAAWHCRCSCGTELVRTGHALSSGRTLSCGCLQVDRARAANKVHGQSRRPVYRVWSAMKGRCTNPTDKRYADYGGRGIAVCQDWAESFERFAADMGPRPSAKHSIERKDNDGPYAPWNCYWATDDAQRANKRTNHRLTYRGETLTVAQWAARLNRSQSLIHDRLRMGWTDEDALTRPTGPQGRRASKRAALP